MKHMYIQTWFILIKIPSALYLVSNSGQMANWGAYLTYQRGPWPPGSLHHKYLLQSQHSWQPAPYPEPLQPLNFTSLPSAFLPYNIFTHTHTQAYTYTVA